jgi:hypothetical protein
MSQTAALRLTYLLELSKLRVEHTSCIIGTYSHLVDRMVDPIRLQAL